MEHFAGIEVPVESASVCIIDQTGAIMREAKVASEPAALIEEAMLGEPDVRVHWGLHMDRISHRNTDFRVMYPRWDAFEATFRRFNAKGTFHNAFTDRIGLS